MSTYLVFLEMTLFTYLTERTVAHGGAIVALVASGSMRRCSLRRRLTPPRLHHAYARLRRVADVTRGSTPTSSTATNTRVPGEALSKNPRTLEPCSDLLTLSCSCVPRCLLSAFAFSATTFAILSWGNHTGAAKHCHTSTGTATLGHTAGPGDSLGDRALVNPVWHVVRHAARSGALGAAPANAPAHPGTP
jgi:hypothetical protein